MTMTTEGGGQDDHDKEPSGTADDTQEAADRRSFHRIRVLWGGTLRVLDDGSTLTCTMANISTAGAKVMYTYSPGRDEAQAIARLETGLRVVLILPDKGSLPAEVTWTARGSAGIAFLLDPDEAARRLGKAARRE